MTFFTLVTVHVPTPTPPVGALDESRAVWLESWTGDRVVPVSLYPDGGRLLAQRGMFGLGVNPSDVTRHATPGMAGSVVAEVSYPERPVTLPLALLGSDQGDLWTRLQALRDLTDPARDMTPDGSFRLVVSSPSGVRQLGLVYASGLEGQDTEWHGSDRVVLDCLAPQPYAEDRATSAREFRLVTTLDPFLVGYTTPDDEPWPRRLSPSIIMGSGNPVEMASAVPVYPVLDVTGPADSLLITSDTGLRIDVPEGVPPGSLLHLVTDPRRKSVRLDGELAAGRLARGSRFTPFPLGATVLSVTAPGATGTTSLRLSWRGLHRSLW